MSNLASLSFRLGANITEFQTNMRKAVKTLKKAGEDMKRVGSQMSTYVTAPIVAGFGLAVKSFAEFEQEMAKVKAVSGASNAEFKALEANAKKLGSSTRYAASEVAALQLNYSKLGFNPTEIQSVTSATLSLALATGEDLADSATVAASTLRGFGMQAEEMNVVVDVMAKSFSSSALDLEKFKTAMGVVAPVSKNAGVSIQQTTALLSTLVDRGVDASTAGTGVRNIFLDIAKSGLTLDQALEKIRNSSNQNATAMDMFGKRGATVAAILANNKDAADKLTLAYLNSAGASAEMAAIMEDTLMGAFDSFKSSIEGVMLGIGESLKPIIEKATTALTRLADAFNGLSGDTKVVIAVFGLFLAAIGPLLAMLGFMITGISGLGAAFAFLTGPIGLAIVAVAAIAAAFVYAYDNWGAIKERISDINWWRNALIDMVKFFVKINPISAFIDAYNGLITYLGGKAIPNPFDNINEYLDSLKGKTKEYEHQFGSFGQALRNSTKDALGALGLMNTQTDEIAKNTAAATAQMQTLGGVSREVTAAIGSMTMIGSGGMQIQGGEGEGKMKKSGGGLPLFDEMIDQGAELRETFGAIAIIVGTTMSDAFYQALDSGEDFLKTLGKMLIDVVKKLAAAAASAIALSLAMSLITGGASNAGLWFGMNGVGGLGDLFSGLFGQLGGIPGMAAGGIVPPGFPNDTYPAFLSSGETVIPSPQPLGGGAQDIRVYGTIRASGKDLLLVIDNETKTRKIKRGY